MAIEENQSRELTFSEPEEGLYNAYANIVNLNWTLFDVRLRFGELIQVTNPDAPTGAGQIGIVEERVAVTLPWHQVKLLRDNLDDLIKRYEKVNGELKQVILAPTE